MKASQDNGIAYEVIRSRRSTADIIIERDGSVLVRAPEWADDDQVANIVESKHYWIYQGLAEWRDLNATRVLPVPRSRLPAPARQRPGRCPAAEERPLHPAP